MWNDGYFTDDTYTYGYYRALSPFYQRYCLLANSFEPPESDAQAVHCELGFGQGVSLNIHAAAVPGRYYGTDFTPAHAAHANSLLRASGADGTFFDLSFAELLGRDDLPAFDSISAHGVWSWISSQNQDIIVAFVRKFLKPGGILYLSYNCYPGWAEKHPLRELLLLKDVYARTAHSTRERATTAIQFAQEALAHCPPRFKDDARLKQAIERLKNADPAYVAHEYLNRDWNIMYFTEVAQKLTDAKVDYACTSNLLDALDMLEELNIENATWQYLNTFKEPLLREELRDIIINRQFRGDLYVRGARRLSFNERCRRILGTRYILLEKSPSAELNIKGYFKQITVKPELAQKLLDHLRADAARPQDFLAFAAARPDLSLDAVAGLLIAMVNGNIIAPCQDDETVEAALPFCNRLNRCICRTALDGDIVRDVASPVLGRGISLDRISQMMLHFTFAGQGGPGLAQLVWRELSARKQDLVVNGAQLTTEDDNLAELNRREEAFLSLELPLLKRLKIVSE